MPRKGKGRGGKGKGQQKPKPNKKSQAKKTNQNNKNSPTKSTDNQKQNNNDTATAAATANANQNQAQNGTANNNNNNTTTDKTENTNLIQSTIGKGTTANGDASTANGTSTANNNNATIVSNPNEDQDKDEKQDISDLLMRRNPRRWQVDKDKTHPFWDDQPVPRMRAKIKDEVNEPIEVKTLNDVRKEPLLLPANYFWCDLDLRDDSELTELYNLLYNHYVEDDDNMFRFNYSKKFLQWALLVPGYLKQWHLGVRFRPKSVQDNNADPNKPKKKGKLVACITAIPATVNIREKVVKMVEINFLCVYKTLRSKRLAPVLIKEITRRVNCQNIWQAVYTAGVVIPKPVASNRYWHRSLNPKKLIDIGFSCMRQRMTMPRLLRLYRVDKETKVKGLRQMELKDCEQCWKLLNQYLSKFALKIEFTFDEFKHLILPRDDVIFAYVVTCKRSELENSNNNDKNDKNSKKANNKDSKESQNDKQENNNDKPNEAPEGATEVVKNENNDDNAESKNEDDEVITDFFSYYNLSSSVINNPKYTNMKAAYSYYNVSTRTPLTDLISDALVLAHKQGFDVFNALDVMENSQFLKELKFGIGDGRLQYYMYNWQCAELKPGDVGIVLL